MGNNVATGSPIENIGKIDFQGCSEEDINKQVHLVVKVSEKIALSQTMLSKKDLKDITRCGDVMSNLLDDLHSGKIVCISHDELARSSLQAILHLLSIPTFSKKSFQSLVPKIVKFMESSNIQLFTFAILTFLNGFRTVEDDSARIGGLRSSNDEPARVNVCILIDKYGVYSRLVNFLARLTASPDDAMILPAVLIFGFLSWVLNRTTNSSNNIRSKIRQILIQHQDTLFELSRHSNDTLSHSALSMLSLLMKQDEKAICIAMQNSSRSYGCLLWSYTRLVSLIMRPENDLSHEKKDQNSAEGSLSAYRSGDQQHASDEGAGGGMLDSLFPSDLMLEFVPPIEIPSLAERISGLEMFLTLMCQGNAVNTEAILSSLPNAMRHTLSPQQSFMMLRHFIYSPPPPEPFYLSQFVDKMKSMKSSWHILFFMLQQHVENPLLLWNGDTLRLLHASLTQQCENLDFLRRLRHEAWDARHLEVDYGSLYSRNTIVVQGLFVHRVIDVLELGRSEYITYPVSFAWGLLDKVVSASVFASPAVSIENSSQTATGRLLLLRVFHILLLRYHAEICNQIPVAPLCALLSFGLKSADRKYVPSAGIRHNNRKLPCQQYNFHSDDDTPSCNPEWLHRCVSILQLRLHFGHISDLLEFKNCGGLDTLISILSDINIMKQLANFEIGDFSDDEGDHFGQRDSVVKISIPTDDALIESDPDEDSTINETQETKRQLNSSSQNIDLTATSTIRENNSSRRVITQKQETTTTEFAVTQLEQGYDIMRDVAILLHFVVMKSEPCVVALVETSKFQCLVRSLWLLSSHGVNHPERIDAPLDHMVQIFLRLLHASPSTLYAKVLDSELIRVLIACAITPSGEGQMTPSIAELISDILVSSNFLDATTITELDNSDKKISSSKRRPSFRQMLIEEGSKSNQAQVSSEGRSSKPIRDKPELSIDNLRVISKYLPVQIAKLISTQTAASFCKITFNKSVSTVDCIWDQSLRLNCIRGIYMDLVEWHKDSFESSIFCSEAEEKISNKLVEEHRFSKLNSEPQVNDLYLKSLCNMVTHRDVIGSIDMRSTIAAILRELRASVIELRSIASSSSSRGPRSSLLVNLSSGITSDDYGLLALRSLSVEQRISILVLAMGRLLEIYNFPEDMWRDEVLPAMQSCLENLNKALIARMQISVQDSSDIFRACACCTLFILRSLNGRFVADSVPLPKSFANGVDFTNDPQSLLESTAVLRHCSAILPLFRLLTDILATTSEDANDTDIIGIAVECSVLLLLCFSAHAVESTTINANAKDKVGLIADESAPSMANLPTRGPRDIRLGLRALHQNSVWSDITKCCRYKVAKLCPEASLVALTCLRLFLAQAGENDVKLLGELFAEGLHLFVLQTMLEFLADYASIPSFHEVESSWCIHPVLNFDEKSMDRSNVLLKRASTRSSIYLSPAPIVENKVLVSIEISIRKKIIDIDANLNKHMYGVWQSSNDVKEDGSKVDYSLENNSIQRSVIVECAHLLRIMIMICSKSIMESKDGGSSKPATLEKSSPKMQSANPSSEFHFAEYMDQIFTPSLVHILQHNVSAFLEVVRATRITRRPLVVWNSSLLGAVRNFVNSEIEAFTTSPNSDDAINNPNGLTRYEMVTKLQPEGFKSLHPSLGDEIVLDGVYVGMLLDPHHKDDIGGRDLPSFVRKLQASVSSSKRVMDHIMQKGDVKQKRQSTTGKNSVASQLELKQQVLSHMIRQHPELGYSDLFVVDESN